MRFTDSPYEQTDEEKAPPEGASRPTCRPKAPAATAAPTGAASSCVFCYRELMRAQDRGETMTAVN